MNNFSELSINPKIFQAIDACGYQSPTEIQAKTIPCILQGRDVIGATETGSGKTAAFVLPALHMLAESKKHNKARVLVLTPTRELADQITTAIRKYGKFLKPQTASIIGGASYRHQERMLSQPLDIIVATPGRLLDHLRNNRIDLSAIEMFILDEADRMLDMGFIDDVKLIAQSTPLKKQTLLFTATLNKGLIKSVGHLLNDPMIIDLSKPKMVPTQITQQLFIADNHQQKVTFLENLLEGESIFKGIIFSATKNGADRIAHHLRNQGHNALPLHGDLKQRERKRSLEKLNAGEIQYLVATDVASRGIDVPNISHVINFDIPRCSDDYIHRVGRTGRAGKSGVAISLATRDERRLISSIERHVGSKLQLIDEAREPKEDTYVEEKNHSRKNRSRKSSPDQRRRNDRSYNTRSDRNFTSDRNHKFQANKNFNTDKKQGDNERHLSDRKPRSNFRKDQKPHFENRQQEGYRKQSRFEGRNNSNSTEPKKRLRSDGYQHDKFNNGSRKPRFGENRSFSDRKSRGEQTQRRDGKLRLGKPSSLKQKKFFRDPEVLSED